MRNSSNPGRGGLARAALDLDGGDDIAGDQEKIDLAIAIEPVLDLDVGARRAVEQVCPDRGFDEAARWSRSARIPAKFVWARAVIRAVFNTWSLELDPRRRTYWLKFESPDRSLAPLSNSR